MADKQSREVVVDDYGNKYEIIGGSTEEYLAGRLGEDGVEDYERFSRKDIEKFRKNARLLGEQTEQSGKKIGDALKELTVKISVDVSEAITGLKAVQREAKEATKALRGVEAQSSEGVRVTLDSDGITKYLPIRAGELQAKYLSLGNDSPLRLRISDKRELFEFTTDELTDELAKRKEVAEYLLEDNSRAIIDFGNGYDAIVNAPVRVYVVADGGGAD